MHHGNQKVGHLIYETEMDLGINSTTVQNQLPSWRINVVKLDWLDTDSDRIGDNNDQYEGNDGAVTTLASAIDKAQALMARVMLLGPIPLSIKVTLLSWMFSKCL